MAEKCPSLPSAELFGQNKLYQIIKVEKSRDQTVWKKAIRQSNDRMFVFKILDDFGNPVSFAFDLDNTVVLFFTRWDLVKWCP